MNKFKSTFYMVFEFCDHDLSGLLGDQSINFSLGEIKSILKQLLKGVFFMHTNKVGKKNVLCYLINLNNYKIIMTVIFLYHLPFN